MVFYFEIDDRNSIKKLVRLHQQWPQSDPAATSQLQRHTEEPVAHTFAGVDSIYSFEIFVYHINIIFRLVICSDHNKTNMNQIIFKLNPGS